MKIRRLTLEVLLALALSDTYGYEIHRRVTRDGESAVIVRDWVVYKELSRLEAEGLVESQFQGNKRQYHFTLKGKEFLQSEKHRITRLHRLMRERV